MGILWPIELLELYHLVGFDFLVPILYALNGEVIGTIFEPFPKKVLVDTGPAILISALTNICADAVGAFTGSPEITLLCVGNLTAMAVDFLYQVTFYAVSFDL